MKHSINWPSFFLHKEVPGEKIFNFAYNIIYCVYTNFFENGRTGQNGLNGQNDQNGQNGGNDESGTSGGEK